jgi:hypothetical protein
MYKLILLIKPYLSLAEKVFVTAGAVGLCVLYLQQDRLLLEVALLGLGITYFFQGYVPSEGTGRPESEPSTMLYLVVLVISPKMFWISSSISCLGVAFFLIDFGNTGYMRLLMTGGLSIALCLLCTGYYALTGGKYLKQVIPSLVRAIPFMLMDAYLFFRT